MSIGESLLRIFAGMRPLLPGMAAAVALTLIAMVILGAMGHKAWVDDKRFSLPSLFFSLDGVGTVRLACTWLKLIFVLVFLVSFKKLVLIQYVILIIPGVAAAVLSGDVRDIFSGLFWLVLQLAGLLCANLVCGYILDMNGGTGFLLVYLAISLFVGLLSIYLFLLDLESISGRRVINARRIWGTSNEEEKR